MNPPSSIGRGICFGLVFSLLTLATAAASDKSIRLRNEIITPQISSNAAQRPLALPTAKPVSGLFLIQFNGAVQSDWRTQLENRGVNLLRYVPNDAFIAKISGANLNELSQLNFVRWIGSYRPEHKIQRDLISRRAKGAESSLDIAVWLSPRATEAEAAQARRSLSSVEESNHRFGRVLRGKMNSTQLDTLANSDAVLWIEPSHPMKMSDEVSSKIVAGDGGSNTLLTQSLGYDGSGVTVSVADSGLDSGDTNFMHPDIQGRVSALFYYGNLEDAADEHSHGTHCAGIIAGNGALGETDENGFLYGLGVAPGASLIAQRIFDAVGNYEAPPSFERLTRDAKRAGADIGSNSWGDDTQGRYDLSAMEFDGLVRDADALALGDQPYILEFSAGNAGPSYRTIGSPAVAKNVIATGAANSDRLNLPFEEFPIYADGPDSMADFSSRGPCEDGRIKPDVVAPGSWIASLRSVYANDDYAWWPISENYLYQGGTSQAGPHVAGAAAVFVQFYRAHHGGATPSPALVKAALINSATDMDDSSGTAAIPNMDEGWGRVNLPALVASQSDYEFVDQSDLLTNGAVYEKRVLVGSANSPLKITLAYTDVPGNPASVIALVNDLDLEVFSPDGHVYRGNDFVEGESQPDNATADAINNVEAVHLSAPVPGEYLIRVRGTRIVEDARIDTAAIDQDFALVISASEGAAGAGIVTFNRPVYRAPDEIKLALVDYDLAGQGSVNVLLRSATEFNGETVVLSASGSSGTFTGAVMTATGPAVADGKLQVSHGDNIEAVYADALPSMNRVFTAAADLLPPVISDVSATNRFGAITIFWNTDEPANSIAVYGTNALNQSVTNLALETEHELTLPGLPPNSVQKFLVISEDAAGNRATNDNHGLYFTITNIQPPAILLIDSYAEFIFDPPPLSGYTDALNAIGATYDVFDATTGSEPSLAQLRSYRCVIWRMSDLESPSPTLAQNVEDYVHGGGSLLIASMEAPTRFSDAGLGGFNTNVLQLQSYTEDQPVNEISGAPGDPVGAGIDTILDYSPYEEMLTFLGIPDPSDWILPNANATAAIQSDGEIVGIRSPKTGVDLPGRVVFLSFPLDAVPLDSGLENNRASLLQNVLNFLAPTPGSSTLTLDSDVYSVPRSVVAEVEDPDLQGAGATTIHVHSPHQTNDILVTLNETVRLGLFRGSFLLVPTNTGALGTLTVAPDDTIVASYVDASAGKTLTASAVIETNAPVISGVSIDAGYLEAVVSWETSEESDALVQYSESPSFPVNYTAYDPLRTTLHEVALTGLKPNQTYYARVVSRDRAGNSVTDDNHGTFYTFTTLQPKLPPWSDDLETPSAEWSVFSSEGTKAEWTRGIPGKGETAHSPANCWGSNLGGGSLDLEESFLVSPGVLLTGGNHATLRFWHNYNLVSEGDLTIELATVEIITNVAAPSQLLWQLPAETASDGWEPVELDLTPYMGQVVYIVYYYFLFSGEDSPRPGWLVDDVSITVTNVQSGTIQITNNLWQANFALSGPVGRTGSGAYTLITNAPPGQYTLEFGDVRYYQTPAPQTNTLAPGGTVTFQGNYTFVDSNTNGLPDEWELAMFGALDSQRNQTTDTDGDGVSDWAEFVAGTNPNDPPQAFQIIATRMPNGAIQLSWPSISNRVYRVEASTNLMSWAAISDWITASGTNTTFTLPATNGAPQFFRVEIAPLNGANALPATFQIKAQAQANGAMRLDWPSAIGHAYRVSSSSDLTHWTPRSDWIRATSAGTSFTNSSEFQGGAQFFRVEAAP